MMSGASKDAALIVSRVSERTYKGPGLGRGKMGGPNIDESGEYNDEEEEKVETEGKMVRKMVRR